MRFLPFFFTHTPTMYIAFLTKIMPDVSYGLENVSDTIVLFFLFACKQMSQAGTLKRKRRAVVTVRLLYTLVLFIAG